MIDTVVLRLTKDDFMIIDHDKFTPSTLGLYQHPYYILKNGYFACVQNISKKDKRNGNYMPQLTAIKRATRKGLSIELKVQFSAPKILYGNNFDEVEDKDFPEICSLLNVKLYQMGIKTSVNAIKSALLSGIHFSKNIILTNRMVPWSIIKEINKCKISQVYNCNSVEYRNNGNAFKIHTNSFELIFYDKLEDLRQSKISEKKSIENENYVQLDILDFLQKKLKPFEVFRMEARLNSAKKIKDTLGKVGFAKPITFENIFNKELSQQILVRYWKDIEESYPIQLGQKMLTPEKLITDFLKNNQFFGYKEMFEFVGYAYTIDNLGTGDTRMLTKSLGSEKWYKYQQRLKKFKYSNRELPIFEVVKKGLNEFKTVKVVDYEEQLLNNDKNG